MENRMTGTENAVGTATTKDEESKDVGSKEQSNLVANVRESPVLTRLLDGKLTAHRLC